jgi:hypothetical protein
VRTEATEMFFPNGGWADGDTPFVNRACHKPPNRAKFPETVIRSTLIALQGQALAMRPSGKNA